MKKEFILTIIVSFFLAAVTTLFPNFSDAEVIKRHDNPLASIRAMNPQGITSLASRIHLDMNNMLVNQKVPLAQAVLQKKNELSVHPDVGSVILLPGNNLMVRFKDNNELLMLMDRERMGGSGEPVIPAQNQYQMQQPTAVNHATPKISAEQAMAIQAIPFIMPCTTSSNKALVFDGLSDDLNAVNPAINSQVKFYLESMGYSVTTALGNNANLANAALIDDGEYGVVFMRGHGGDIGNDFVFLVRPWYPSYPAANSGYNGTIRLSAFNHVTNSTQFGYGITKQFSTTYWMNKTFPGTFFFLESCHGTDPGALPGMPSWTVSRGASAWLGWNESVTFNCGDNGTKIFFQLMSAGKGIGEAVSSVYATGCRPPVLTIYPGGKNQCKPAKWYSDPNETATTDSRDFKQLQLLSDGNALYAKVTFHGIANFDELFLYVDTNGSGSAEVLVKLHPMTYEVYKQSQPGLYGIKSFIGSPKTTANSYMVAIPWVNSFGAVNSVRVWLYDMTGKDRMPDSGVYTVLK